jgi:hypothetical protein
VTCLREWVYSHTGPIWLTVMCGTLTVGKTNNTADLCKKLHLIVIHELFHRGRDTNVDILFLKKKSLDCA